MLWDEEKMRDGETVCHGEGRRVENASCNRPWNHTCSDSQELPVCISNLQSGLTSKGEGTGKMPGIRVLVVDDSVVIRKVLCEAPGERSSY
jgi:hypothetical protein